MKKFRTEMLSLFTVAGLLLVVTSLATGAITKSGASDLNKLNAEISMLNSAAILPQGETVLRKELSDNFRVGSDKISNLIAKTTKYGDIAAILAFSEKMSGGITDSNINQIMNMRTQGRDWDQIAKSTKVQVGDVANKLSSFEDKVHRNIKQAYAESLAAGAGAGGMESTPGDIGAGGLETVPGEATGGTGTLSDVPGETGAGGLETLPGEATGGTGTLSDTPGEMYGTDNGSYGDYPGGAGGSDSGNAEIPGGSDGATTNPGAGY